MNIFKKQLCIGEFEIKVLVISHGYANKIETRSKLKNTETGFLYNILLNVIHFFHPKKILIVCSRRIFVMFQISFKEGYGLFYMKLTM